MATAVEPGSEPRTPSTPVSLPVASLFGALYVAAAVAVVFYAVPALLREMVFPSLTNRLAEGALLLLLLPVAFGVLVWFGRRLLGDNPPKGVYGGIFLMIVWAALIFFLWRAVALSFEGMPGLVVSAAFAAFLVYLAAKFFRGRTGERWMVGLEEQGWFSTASYKRSLGQRARRFTTAGLLILGGTGILALRAAGTLPENWSLSLPFESPNSVVLAPNAQIVIPALLALLTWWFAWRAVNVPTFAEFLIATEAEMNKVSWTPKKRLFQDTVVVLTTLLLMTVFLLVVDLFWGWLLSTNTVGVLPSRSTGGDKGKVQQAKW